MKSFLTVLLLMLFACNDNIPKDILKPEKMQLVLFDIMQADELVNVKYTSDTSFNRLAQSVDLYRAVFKIHNVSANNFKSSFTYYQNHPELLKPILDSLQKTTQRRVETHTLSYPAK